MNDLDPNDNQKVSKLLQELIQAVEASGYAVLPRTDQKLLESVVEAAARILNAKAASIALVDQEAQELEFKVDFNQSGGVSVIGLRTPIDRGIAGHVAMTGQPMAVSNVQEDNRFNQQFAESTGYVPKAILAVPLIMREQVIGVMEVLDKNSASPFNLQDIELLTIFARQAAIAIDQAQLHQHIGEALAAGLRRISENLGEEESNQLEELLSGVPGEIPSDLQQLATLFGDIAALGSAERQVCLEILEAFSRYGRRKRRLR